MNARNGPPLSRRTLLALAAASVPATSSGVLFAQRGAAGPLTLVFEGLSGQASYDVVGAFLERGLPVAAVLDIGSDTVAPFPQEFAQYDGLFEILAPTPDVADLPRFAQSRGAAQQRSKLDRLLPSAIPSVGLINREDQSGLDFAAFRSAGFRVLITTDDTRGVEETSVGRGQINLRAGDVLDTSPKAPPLKQQCDDLLASGRSHVVILSLARLEESDGADFADQLSLLVDDLEAKVRQGLLVMMRPMDHLLLTAVSQARPTAVLLEVTPETVTAAAAMIARADASGIPITVAGTAQTLKDLGRPGDCLTLPSRPWNSTPVLARCVLADPGDTAQRLGASEIVLERGGTAISHSQIAADGRLHATVAPWAMLVSDAPVLADPIVLIAAADYATPQQHETIFRIFEAQAQSGKSWFLTIAGWANYLTAPDRLFARFRSARRRNLTDPPPAAAPPLSDQERAAFMTDARAAWAYIANHTQPETGLVLSTVQAAEGGAPGDQFVNTQITLWDLGSQIQGILAAHDIGLIPLQERDDRVATLAAHIPVIAVDGARLPPAMFSVRTLQPLRRDFDICDLGRFLLALDDAVAQGALAQADADALTAQWDIDAAVRDGRLHSYRAGRWFDITVSHCTDYILPAFMRRGFAVENLYPPLNGVPGVEDEMTILARAAFAGAVGTEPTLLELVEGEGGPVAALLSDVLFDAQLGWFETEGQFRSVSETPLNRAPWFLYQGLFLEREGANEWAINSIDPSPEFTTEAFRKEAEVIVSKSAYLWRAARPHAYSRALVNLIRENCRVEDAGFTVGVFASTQAPMRNYFDINTNGIILSALRRILA